MRARAVLVSILALVLVACGDGDGPTSSTPAADRARITVTVTPSPAIARPSTNPDFRWQAEFDVVVRETAGLGLNVDFIDLTLGEGFSSLNFGADVIIREAGTNRVAPRGTLSIPLGIVYTGLFGARNIDVNVLVQGTDDRRNSVTGTAVLQIR